MSTAPKYSGVRVIGQRPLIPAFFGSFSSLGQINGNNSQGMDINAAGSFKASMDILSTKANKANYALNNFAKLKLLPIKTALRLFDAAILPILTYGSEIRALNSIHP